MSAPGPSRRGLIIRMSAILAFPAAVLAACVYAAYGVQSAPVLLALAVAAGVACGAGLVAAILLIAAIFPGRK